MFKSLVDRLRQVDGRVDLPIGPAWAVKMSLWSL